jgi:hypothetical protein
MFKTGDRWAAAAFCLSFCLAPAFADEGCALCTTVRVGTYDLSVAPLPSPITTNMFFLFDIGHAVGAQLCGPFRVDCITHLDGALMNAPAQNGALRFGQMYANLPPAGPIPALDYLITGSVADLGSGWQATIEIQTAVSRETVASTSFTFPYTFTLDDLSAQWNAAAAALGPLEQTLANYESTKRDRDTTVAIGEKGTPGAPHGLTVSLGASDLKRGDSTDVYLQLTDCDGQPLASRELILEAFTDPDLGPFDGPTGGTVSPTRVTTDANGQATVKFTAGDSSGVATIPAYSIYFRPTGNKLAFLANGTLNVEAPPQWRIQVDFYAVDAVNQDYTETDELGPTTTNTFEQTIREDKYSLNYTCEQNSNGSGCGWSDGVIYKFFFAADQFNRTPSGYSKFDSYKRFYSYTAESEYQKLYEVDDISSESWNFPVPSVDNPGYAAFNFSQSGSGTPANGPANRPLGRVPPPRVPSLANAQLSFNVNDFVAAATLYNSSYSTPAGWQDSSGPEPAITGGGISCKSGDPGWSAAVTPKGFYVTCVQISDTTQDENWTEHVETRVYVQAESTSGTMPAQPSNARKIPVASF